MQKTTHATSGMQAKEGRLLARVLAEDLRWAHGQTSAPFLDAIVTGEVRRDWSAADEDGLPAY
jgi:hypothetical protein